MTPVGYVLGPGRSVRLYRKAQTTLQPNIAARNGEELCCQTGVLEHPQELGYSPYRKSDFIAKS
jgi:hypothetical protein